MLSQAKIPLIFISVLVGLSLIWLFFSYNPLETQWFPKCPLYTVTSFYCPGCGSQRALHAILHGDIVNAIGHNVLILLLFAIITYEGIVRLFNHYSIKPIKNWLHSSKITFSILMVVLLFWVFRNIDIYPFSILAP